MSKRVLAVIVVLVLAAAALGGGAYAYSQQRQRDAARQEAARVARERAALTAAFTSADVHVAAAQRAFNDVEYAYNGAFYARTESAQELAAPYVKELDGAVKELAAAEAALPPSADSSAAAEYRSGLADLREAVAPTKASITLIARLASAITSGAMGHAEWQQRTTSSNDRLQSVRLKQKGFASIDQAHALLQDELRALSAPRS